MKKLIAIVFYLAATYSCYASLEKKHKILVLTSDGGNGHMVVCNVLQDILPNYDLKLVHPIQDFFGKGFDPERSLYGKLLQNGWIRTINFIVDYPGQMYFKINKRVLKKQILRYIDKEKPDLLISVIPMVTYPAACAAQERGIPFLFITLDADLTLWLIDMERFNMEQYKKHNFIMTVQTKTPLIKKQLEKKHIPLSCVREVGGYLRKDFFNTKNTEKITKEWNIPTGKKIALLMRGSTGSNKLVDYVKELIKLNTPLHLLVCIGKNNKLVKKLSCIKTNGPVSFSIIPFTQKISDLMAISDILIAQPSATVSNEAIQMNLPMLIDRTGACLTWEKANSDRMLFLGYGDVFRHMKELNPLVMNSLSKKQKLIEKKPKAINNFNAKICSFVNSLIS